jgi:Leucine-rich repeat (LRR) protein
MVLKYYGKNTDPSVLNSWLNANAGYTLGGLLDWNKPAEYSAGLMTHEPGLSWSSETENDRWAELHAQVVNGYPAIVKVDSVLATPELNSHWIVVTSFVGGEIGDPANYRINDPWDRPESRDPDKRLSHFHDDTYDNTFFAMRVYHGTSASQPVYFADENLKAAVKAALGITTDPTAPDMLRLTVLHIYGSLGITNLTGLECAANLQEMCIYDNLLVDLTPLAGLANLKGLSLKNNEISSLMPLAGLANIEGLDVENNQVSDLTPIAELRNLCALCVNRNEISDLIPLTGLTKLSFLHLEGNPISDVKPLAGLTALTELNLACNAISDLTPLAELTNLNHLDLSESQIRDLAFLAGLTNLNYLDLSQNQISDLAPLAGLTEMDYLYLNQNQISNLTPLAGLTAMKGLDLFNNEISDIAPLGELTNLEFVFLYANPLNCEAYHSVIPQILENNPQLWSFAYDPMPPECLEPQPEEIIEEVAKDLEDILAANPDTPLADNVGDAMAYAKAACDQLTTTPPNNRGAVQNVEKAVGELQEAVRKKLLDAGQGNQLMDQLAGAARQIAADAIEQARASGGKAGKIAEAERELADGDALRSAGAFERAVDKYKDALVSAEKAI